MPMVSILPPPPDDALARRRQLQLVTLAWVFGTAWLFIITGAAMTQFARSIGMPDYAFGILAALPFAGSLAQLPISYVLERFGGRRLIFIVALTVARALWVVVAAVPWLLPGRPQWWWPTMLVLLALSWACAQAGGPPWFAWMSDVIPRRLRGRYMAFRNQVTTPLAVAMTLGIGYLLDRVAADAGMGAGASVASAVLGEAGPAGAMMRVTSLLLIVGGLLGVLDIQVFWRIPDPNEPGPQADLRWWRKLREPWADPGFRRYLAFDFTMMLGLGFIGQYIWLFVLDVGQVSNSWANIMLVAVPMVLRMLSMRVWGRLVDRLGKKPVLIIAGTLFVFGPVGWFLVGPGRTDWLIVGYLLTTISPLSFPGVELAKFNMVLDYSTSTRRRGEHHAPAGGSAYIAVNSIAVALGGVLSGYIGAQVAGSLIDFQTHVPLFGLVWTYHHVLFAISSGFRLAAVGWAMTLHEPRAKGTREALVYMTTGLYNNVRHVALLPTRVVGRAASWAYRIDHRRRRPQR